MALIQTEYPALWIWAAALLFALIHSVMASRPCKLGYYAMGISPRTYRLMYSAIAVFTLCLWLGLVWLLPDRPLYSIAGYWRWLLHGMQAIGAWVFWLSLRPIDIAAFIGFKAFAEDIEPFIEKGIFQFLRHPMYTGIMLVMFAWPDQTVNSLNLFAAIALYFIIGSRFEEGRMLATHPDYADYKRRVPAFIPRLFFRRD